MAAGIGRQTESNSAVIEYTMESYMTTSERTAASDQTTDTRNLATAIRYYAGLRWALVVLAAVAVVGGVMLNWSWLVAAGIAPILLTALPCLLMCGFGLCAHKLVGR